jgi:hypothetical protein
VQEVIMAKSYDIGEFIGALPEWLEAHRIGTQPGSYARYSKTRPEMAHTPNPYGSADAANILYTINRMPRNPAEKAGFVRTLQDFQDPMTGEFREPTHAIEHVTAHVTAALELFDALPRYPLAFLRPLLEKTSLWAFLDNLDWNQPWSTSHKPAGVAAALLNAEAAPREWFDWFFEWFGNEVDPETGMWRRGAVLPTHRPAFDFVGGAFHIHFIYDALRVPWPHPELVIDFVLAQQRPSGLFLGDDFFDFPDIDGVYCISRALRQCGYRGDDCRAALRRTLDRCCELVLTGKVLGHPRFDDLHVAFGTMCCLAELQQALPGMLRTPRPLRLVLDRRPFI